MKLIRFAVISAALIFIPTLTLATNDASISSAEITTPGSSTAGANASYTIGITPTTTFEDGDTVTMFAQEYPDGSPLTSGFDFTDTYALSAGCGDVTGSAASVNSGAGVSFTFGASHASQCIIGLGDVVNSATSGCYTFIFTTDASPSEGSDYTSISEPFAIGSGSCDAESDVALLDVAATVFGENIGIEWEPVDGASSYSVIYSTISEDDAADPTSETNVVSSTTDTFKTLELEPSTTYYWLVDAFDETGETVVAASATEETATTESISSQKASRPKILKKQRKSKKLTIKWDAPAAIAYVSKYKMQVYKKSASKWKKIRTYKSIDSSKVKKVAKKLKSSTKYKIRMKVVYDTEDVSAWSKYSVVRQTKP
ncbi:MAG: hypothetical protein COW24_00770 [Candidatus Kerfeldbacteria bacterium CG15_BIG_FIL_POST_REV_8_21_14_020_45_12]|uniref:Fibronectin type-III domain-containing protein n=1 Tax=Candidatus Kerfeldbacteria bacterium CG15_BIG_FIL_POST_REV_8_21_14_020_45_12 TaxID=2014247 RepID=A0A2M7H532_9BACT|nr:MAG: hypothetical protein COW24_00770 [Candidatus Kerfeldbacteria bacterium CG15_BIG_FIL_POST_REV_8_21_14_020_45_12]PJA93150.1 MAG: hypothetical protein CO132_04590 [Candidatus Kerfeldbacteria bacterium CG_4_9_14_3_um_filter_45_8]